MLFGVNFCRRCDRVRKKRPSPQRDKRLCLILTAAGLLTVLLFLAPQWLLVLLVLTLTAALFVMLLWAER